MKHKSAIIIGAGIGGLATAIQLAKKGVEVTVYEKNHKAGGRCGQIIKDGHVFDTGPTMFIFPNIYASFFAAIGENLGDYINLIPANPTYKLNFADRTRLLLTPDQELMEKQLEAIEPGSYRNFLAYQQLAKKHYEITVERILRCGFTNPLELLHLKPLEIIGARALDRHTDVVKKYFKHPNLVAAFTFQDSYLSLHPFESPAVYSSFSYTELNHGNYLPQGGMYQVIMALERIAVKVGVAINYGHEVAGININGHRADGVALKNGQSISADVIVVNAELPFAYEKLLPKSRMAKTLKGNKYSCSALVFHWGLDKVYPQLQTHNLFFAKNYKLGFDQVLKQSIPPREPHFYIQVPTRIDSTRGPVNQDTLTVMIPINHLEPGQPIDWPGYRQQVRKYIFNRMELDGLKNIKRHIKFEESFLPPDWQRYLNLPFGSIYGLHHNFAQLGPFRPKRVHPNYKNVYFVGASTHPGSGLPTVLVSSELTSQRVLRDLIGSLFPGN